MALRGADHISGINWLVKLGFGAGTNVGEVAEAELDNAFGRKCCRSRRFRTIALQKGQSLATMIEISPILALSLPHLYATPPHGSCSISAASLLRSHARFHAPAMSPSSLLSRRPLAMLYATLVSLFFSCGDLFCRACRSSRQANLHALFPAMRDVPTNAPQLPLHFPSSYMTSYGNACKYGACTG
jgi:hypothetical protein